MKPRLLSLGIIAWIFICFPFVRAEIENPVDFALKDASSGETVKLSDYMEKQVIVLHFWKSGWRECHAEFPHLNNILKSYADENVKVLSINPIDREGKIKSEITRYKIPYPVLIGRSSRVIADYGIKELPHLFIIDREGKIVFQGKFLESEKMEEILNPLVTP